MNGNRHIDHLIVDIYTRKESGGRQCNVDFSTMDRKEYERLLAGAADRGLIELVAENPRLTSSGESVAKDLLRRHRLAERLLSDVIGMEEDILEEEACGMEHVLSPGVTDAICTLLGHPPTCPHGRPIAPGPCCRESWNKAPAVIVPLVEFVPGTKSKIVFVGGRHAVGISRLADIGIVPGAEIVLRRLRPVPTIELGETTVAVEEELVKQIFVRKA